MGKGKKRSGPRRPVVSRSEHRSGRDYWAYIVLVLAVLVVYSQVRAYEFVSYDDPIYVTGNPVVRAGLTSHGVVHAFTSSLDGNWFPLTWISHTLDWQLFGPASGLHHLTSVLIHLCSSLLLFAVLKRMTGSRWRSLIVAALFALHPLHVESVAWVAERKDVLCGFFWILAIWGYARYTANPRPARYLLVLVPFCLGLMAKPMIVTLPFVLLLLDVWPLRRISLSKPLDRETAQDEHEKAAARPSVAAVFLEKVPLFALSAAFAVVTFVVQRGVGAVMPLAWIPFGTRLGNAFVSYVTYLAQTFWPTRLAAFYPHPVHLPAWEIAGAVLIVVGISALVLRSARRLPSLAVGWFWYLGTLVPVIGLVQVGMQARADRYTYIPLIGIFIMLAWGLPDALERWPRARSAFAGVTAIACCACLPVAWYQVQNWRNSETLYQHAIAVTTDNYVAYYSLGNVMKAQGRLTEATRAYLAAIRIVPYDGKAYGGLAGVLLVQGRVDDGVKLYRESLRLAPDSAEAKSNLDKALAVQAGAANRQAP